ncbi:thiopurine S-methyltransferase [Thiohalorhabdus denitrificans]|uniref:Thiopurine S-methyltransferase n=1 Tax=Thiohalorhabdus denitrificans TaxID=381306 RepID=A0A0P9C750_9GAMM|nr:thiopurine S-methyltransferase [Thiohalorhabdus denitrificans]KPV39031.1 thiopurine S-methyltransferase [Thiohalorhabdus denitrificans]SCX79560.1 thiopurine S-methyltransferase [Thiohalorhabdus denitrificans]
MDREFWLDRWKNNRINWHLEKVNPHLLDFWPEMPVPAGGRVFVPLCGKTVDMHWLAAERGHTVVGVELSEQACRDFYAENGMEPEVTEDGPFLRFHAGGVTILCGDFFDLDADRLGPVDGVFDRASFIALPPEMRERYGRAMHDLLPSRPPILFWTLEYPQEQMSGPPFAVHEPELETLYGSTYELETLRLWDVLEESPGFREAGVTELREHVYRLTARE